MTQHQQLESKLAEHALDHRWALRRFRGYYHRYAVDGAVGQDFGELCLEARDRLLEARGAALGDPALEVDAAELLVDILTGRAGPSEVRQLTGLGMEAPLLLHRLTGGHREHYLQAISELPELNAYRPEYMNLGPTGKCNVVCPDCIIGGAIFAKERQRLHAAEEVLPHLEQAEAAGVTGLSFCIGEPSYNPPLLYAVLDRVRESSTLYVRSLVTNALFAKSGVDKAARFFEGVREHLGEEKAARLVIGISLNHPLRGAGVPVEATANALEAFGRVFPGQRMMLQFILDEGYHLIQNELYEELGRRGLLEDWRGYLLESEGAHAELPLAGGVRVVTSTMRKQPSLHNPKASAERDPWVRYYTPEALMMVPLKGLYSFDDGEDDTGAGEVVVDRITLGPDGLFYPDYHFMVAGARPLGATLTEATASFRQDPILSLLLERGGLNALLATYMSIPAEERVLSDIYEPALACSTAGMVAANVIFGDYEVALQLAGRIMSHGVSAPGG